jgi:hypothetical protein
VVSVTNPYGRILGFLNRAMTPSYVKIHFNIIFSSIPACLKSSHNFKNTYKKYGLSHLLPLSTYISSSTCGTRSKNVRSAEANTGRFLSILNSEHVVSLKTHVIQPDFLQTLQCLC